MIAAPRSGRPLPSIDQVTKWHTDLMADEVMLDRLLLLKGWTRKALDALKIGFDGHRITIPYFEWEKLANVMLYLPDRPVTETGSKMLPFSGGHGRSLYPDPSMVPPGGFVFLVEGEPDVITAKSAGLDAIAVPGANGWRKSYAGLLQGHRIVVCFDDDKPGKRLTEKVVADLTDTEIEVRVLDLSTANDEAIHGFDLGDYVARAISEAEPDEDLGNLVSLFGKSLRCWAETIDPLVVEDESDPDESHDAMPDPKRNLPEILGDIEKTLQRFVVLPSQEARAALALWVVHTWAFEAAHATPYMLVISAEKRSGKTRLLEILTALVRKPWATVDVSEAALFRKIAQDQPTCLIDEIDAIFGGAQDRTEPIRSILNAGNRSVGSVSRCVGQDQRVEDFPVFSPKLLAGIDKGERLPDTIRDRSVTIPMVRKTTDEPVSRLLPRKVHPQLQDLRADLEGWATRNIDNLHDAEPDLPGELDDRAAEAWEPLFAIADLAGGRWHTRAREAARALSSAGEGEGQTYAAQLLEAIRGLMGPELAIATKDIIAHVNCRDDLTFGGWREGKGIDARTLARQLKPYGVKAKKVHLSDGTKAQGYHRDDLSEAWARWLPGRACLEKEPAEPTELGTQEEPEATLDRAKVPLVPEVPDISEKRVDEGASGPNHANSDSRVAG